MGHIHEKIDFTVEVFVVHTDKVLLRKHDKYNIWLGVGGHIELDEDPEEAAIREVKEEVGLDVRLIDTRICKDREEDKKELIPPLGMSRHHISETHEHITLFYAAMSESDVVVPEKNSDEWVWCHEGEIDAVQGISHHISVYAKEALRLARER